MTMFTFVSVVWDTGEIPAQSDCAGEDGTNTPRAHKKSTRVERPPWPAWLVPSSSPPVRTDAFFPNVLLYIPRSGSPVQIPGPPCETCV